SGCPLIPCSVKRSWRLRLAWVTFTRTQSLGASGSGRLPILSASSGSSGAACVAYTANIGVLLSSGTHHSRDDFQRGDPVAFQPEEGSKDHGTSGKVTG